MTAARGSGKSTDRRAAERARLGTTAVFFICGIGHGTWAPRLAELKEQVGASDGQLGMALLMIGLGALIAMPVTGLLIGRLGSRQVSITMALAQALIFPLQALAWHWLALGAAMLLYGLAIASLDVAMNVQATEIERRYGRPIMSSFHGGYSVGDMAGALLTGVAASIALGLASHFFLAAFFMLIAGVGGCLLMIADRQAEPSAGPTFALPKGVLIAIGLIAFASLLAEGSVGDWSAIYLIDYQHSDTETAAIALTVFAFAMAIMRFAGDRLVHRFGPFAILQASGLLAATGLTIALLAPSSTVAILGYGVSGLGVAVLFPVTLSIAPRFSGGLSPGVSVAAVATLGYGGFLVGPPLIGLIADHVGLPMALGIVVLLTVSILPLALLARRTPKGHDIRTSEST
ncbi:MAG: MFS transporter [Alphaproteobacteria bacterium]